MAACHSHSRMSETFIYVLRRSDKSMKWVGCLNYTKQHDPSEKPSESPTATATAAICLIATIEGAETHYIRMKTICYEYEVGGAPQS